MPALFTRTDIPLTIWKRSGPLRAGKRAIAKVSKRQWNVVIKLVTYAIFVIDFTLSMALLLCFVESCILSANTRPSFHFWIQIFTGNWSSPPATYPNTPEGVFKLSLSISIALVLNVASIGLIAVVIKQIATLRRDHVMRLNDLYTVRDGAIKGRVETLLIESGEFSEAQIDRINGIIDQGFQGGDALWSSNLMGSLEKAKELDSAEKTRTLLKEGVITGNPPRLEI